MSTTTEQHNPMNPTIPSVKVEDTTKTDEHANPLNNLDFFRKINALLDNTIDLSALGLANITLPQTDTTKAVGQPATTIPNFDNMQAPLTGLDLYNSHQPEPMSSYTNNTSTYSTTGLSGLNPYATSFSSQSTNNYCPSTTASAPTYNPAPGGLPQPFVTALAQLLANYTQTPMHTPVPSHPPGFVSQPPEYTPHNQYNPYLQHQTEINASFIPGAISNRTLEQLTESSMRPYRAIKAATDKHTYPQSDMSCQSGYTQTSTSVGTIGDRGYHGERHSSPDSKGNSRSSSPAESDSSGFSSGSDSFSDAALADLMHSLNMTTNQSLQQQQQQQTFQNFQAAQQFQPSQTSYGQQLAHQQNQYNLAQNQQLYQQASSFSQAGTAHNQLQHNQYTAAAALAAQAAAQPQFDLMKALGEYCLQNDVLRKSQQPPMLNDFSLSAELFNTRTSASNAATTALNLLAATNNDPQSIERAAKMYRNAATVCEPTCTWSGQLPPKVHKNPTYSCKVFLGGVPWDITEVGLQNAFKMFGSMKIEWPGKDGMHPRYIPKAKSLPAGYVYVLFESEKSVKALLQSCTHDFSNGGEYYFRISSRRMRSKEVQVIPWVLADSNFVKQPPSRLDPSKTVFVGALHGMMNAEGLSHIMNDLFGNVVYAGIDTDKHKYPIGSGRVTFSSHKSYMKAVNAAFVEVKTPKFTKKIQIDPYLEDSTCQSCNVQQGPYFCRDLSCFRYYCKNCWQWYHAIDTNRYHKPLMRNNKGNNNGSSVVSV